VRPNSHDNGSILFLRRAWKLKGNTALRFFDISISRKRLDDAWSLNEKNILLTLPRARRERVHGMSDKHMLEMTTVTILAPTNETYSREVKRGLVSTQLCASKFHTLSVAAAACRFTSSLYSSASKCLNCGRKSLLICCRLWLPLFLKPWPAQKQIFASYFLHSQLNIT